MADYEIENKTTAEAFDKIDDLFEAIRALVKMPELKFLPEIKEDRWGKKRIDFESDDLTESDYLISLAWKRFKISTFNSNSSIDRKTEKPHYWLTVEYDYESHSGGSNGTEIGYAEFQDGKWSFWSEIGRNKDR